MTDSQQCYLLIINGQSAGNPALREAVEALDADRDFLKKGGVMDDDQIDGYLELKWEEIYRFEHTPHPVEFDMYYSV